MRDTTGFTLIELLIVVAIIAILAAIAIPNFQQAQVRAKLSRVMADIKTVSVAMELYRLDYGFHPLRWDASVLPFGLRGGEGDFLKWIRKDTGEIGGPGRLLTHPVAYLTDIPYDPFGTRSVRKGQTPHVIRSREWDTVSYYYRGLDPMAVGTQPWFGADYMSLDFGSRGYAWSLQTCGPDMSYWPTWTQGYEPYYDPTNGTVSNGDIWYFDTVGFRGNGISGVRNRR